MKGRGRRGGGRERRGKKGGSKEERKKEKGKDSYLIPIHKRAQQ